MAVELSKVQEIAARVAASYGLETVDVEMRGAGKHRTLRVTIERQGVAGLESGVTHEDCANVSREMSTILDVEEAIPGGAYTLEVSSPGLDRKLTKASEFERFTGSLVKLMTREPIAGNRHFEGRLEKFADGQLTLDITPAKRKNKPAPEARKIEVAFSNVERANLVPEI
jgi:ribosome maturation factor RimP